MMFDQLEFDDELTHATNLAAFPLNMWFSRKFPLALNPMVAFPDHPIKPQR
jgi:hypothetical protein